EVFSYSATWTACQVHIADLAASRTELRLVGGKSGGSCQRRSRMGSLLQELLTKVPLPAMLRERVALADEKYQRAIGEVESLKQRFAAIERENVALRARAPGEPTSKLGDDTVRVLVHLFMTDAREERDLGTMSKKLGMERNAVQYHLDQLKADGLVDLV